MRRLVVIILAALIPAISFAWGPKGHDIVAYVAEQHLSKRAKRNVEQALGGYSMVYVANWMDNARHTDEYDHTKTWHYVNVDPEEGSYLRSQKEGKGDVVTAVNDIVKSLKCDVLTPEQERVQLMMLIHLVGDMHCPAHIKYTTHNMKYYAFMPGDKKSTYVHTIWDKLAIQETRIYSATEWALILDIVDRKTAKEIAAGTPREWLHDSAVRCEMQFDILKPDQKVDQDFFNVAMPLIETQILYAGYRLAAVLNGLF